MRISDWSSDVCSSDLTQCRHHRRLDRRQSAFEARQRHAVVQADRRRGPACARGISGEPEMTELPNRTPRPPGEFDRLKEVWKPPSGWNFITVVNNTYIGILYIGTAFLFFILAGVLEIGRASCRDSVCQYVYI